MLRSSSAAKYCIWSASMRASVAGSLTGEPHAAPVDFPADQIAGLVILLDDGRSAQRLVLVTFLESRRAEGARATMHAAEDRAILQRYKAARPEQIGGLADAMLRKLLAIV